MDLPAPVGPTIATVSPAATSKLTERRAGARPSKANVRSANLTESGRPSCRAEPGDAATGSTWAPRMISSMRSKDVRPRRTIDSVQPSAIVGHVRYAR